MSSESESVAIRPATVADLDTIAGVQEAAILALGAAVYAPDQLEAWARVGVETRHGLLNQGSFFVAEAEGQAVGVGGWSPDGSDRSVAWIRYLFVRPEAARKGIGRRLLWVIESSAGAAGRHTFHVWASLNALDFYGALGYRRQRAIRVPLGRGIEMSCMHMVKQGRSTSVKQLRGILPKPERPAIIEDMDEAVAQEAVERYLRSTSKS